VRVDSGAAEQGAEEKGGESVFSATRRLFLRLCFRVFLRSFLRLCCNVRAGGRECDDADDDAAFVLVFLFFFFSFRLATSVGWRSCAGDDDDARVS
jgi:hypothetical protein